MIVFSARTSLVLTLITVVLGVCVYLVGIQQDIRQKELARITAEIQSTQDSIMVLQSDWAYLSRPDRILHLSQRLLDLEPLAKHQIIPAEKLDGINHPEEGTAITEANLIWRIE